MSLQSLKDTTQCSVKLFYNPLISGEKKLPSRTSEQHFENKYLNYGSDLAQWMLFLASRMMDIGLYLAPSTRQDRVKMEGEAFKLSWENTILVCFFE